MESRELNFSGEKDSQRGEDIKKLPRYKFAKNIEFYAGEKEDIEAWLDSVKREIPKDYEGLTPEWREKISQTMDFMKLWMKQELQLDPSEKLPSLDKIAVLDQEKFNTIAGSQDLAAYHEPNTGEVLVGVEAGDDFRTITFFSHELIHLLSRHEFLGEMTAKGFGTKGVARSGYRRRYSNDNLTSERLAFLNEGLTELLNIEFLKFSQARDPDTFTTFSWGYNCLRAVLVDALIEKVANEKNPNFRRDLYRGYFTGEMQSFRDLAAVMGKEKLKELAKINYAPSDLESYLEVAQKMGLSVPDLRTTLESIWNEKPIFIANDIKVQTK